MNDKPDSRVRVRFAPSPTGNLHIGSARTALFNWLFARHNGGAFVMRIEDTDVERSLAHYTTSLMDALSWLGIESDEPLVYQSQRFDRYRAYVDQLLATGKAYRCYCTPQELELRLETHEYGKLYDRHCRLCGVHDNSLPHCVRFKVPDDISQINFVDTILGDITIDSAQLDDFVIMRSDGTPVYNFAVVIDDADMRISHVIRGQEHIGNTPKQILLYQAFGFDIPQFAHIPLILGPSGQKLSKRDGATSVTDYKEQGYLAQAMINYLARLGWSHGDQELFTRDELIAAFELSHVGKSNAIFDVQKLLWVNGEHIKRSTPDSLLQALEDIDPQAYKKLETIDRLTREHAVVLYQPRVNTMRELLDEIQLLFSGPREYDATAVAAWLNGPVREHLKLLIVQLRELSSWSANELERVIKIFVKQQGVSLPQLAQPIRIALVGKTASPGIFHMLAILGQKESLVRLEAVLK